MNEFYPLPEISKKGAVADEMGRLYYVDEHGKHRRYKPLKVYDTVEIYKFDNIIYTSLELARMARPDLYPETIEQYDVLTAKLIYKVVCRNYGICEEKINTRVRARAFSEPRMLCSFLRVIVLKHDPCLVSIEHGHRDRTTTLYHLKTVHTLYHTNFKYRSKCHRICRELRLNPETVFQSWKRR